MLNRISHGAADATVPLVVAHGLYGSARNWGVLSKRLSDNRHVVAVDMRNHGTSPWFDSHTYPDMAADLAETITDLGGQADLLGHSMGGKASMTLALTRPDLIRHLIVADIAPVAYDHSQIQYIEAMQAVDLARVDRRSDAEAQLAEHGVEPEIRSFLTQSLDPKERRWRLNLDVLAADMPQILGFPDLTGRFDGPTLFLSGAASNYVSPAHHDRIRALFPAAEFEQIAGAGHWLHAEQPRAFEAAVRAFLDRS